MLAALSSQQPMDTATRKQIAIDRAVWGSLAIGLALVVFTSFLTSSIPHWIGLIAVVAETGLAPIFIKRILRLRNDASASVVS